MLVISHGGAMQQSTSVEGSAPSHALCQLPDELWALVLSKCTWSGAWPQAKVLLCWRRGAARALQAQPQLLAQLLSARQVCSSDSADSSTNALERAASQGRVDVVEALLLLYHWTSADAKAAAFKAAGNGHACTVDCLLQHISIHGEGDIQGATEDVLISAAFHGHMAVLKRALEYGGLDDIALYVSLLAAAREGRYTVVQELLDFGVVEGHDTALSLAAEKGHVRAVEVLLDAGERLGHACLLDVARRGHDGVLQLLLDRGLQMSAAHEEEAVQAAVAAGHRSTAQLLLQRPVVRTRAAMNRLAALME